MKIFINDIELDHAGNATSTITVSVTGEPSATAVTPYSSEVFRVPATPRNLAAFGFPVSVGTLAPADTMGKVTGAFGEIEGPAIITEITQEYIEFTIVSGNAIWVQKVKQSPLRSMDFSDWAHTLNVTNVQASINGSKPYIYDACYRGAPQKEGEMILQERFPAVKVWPLVKKIFNSHGINVISSTLSDDYANLCLLFTQSDDILNSKNFKRARFEVERPNETRSFSFLQNVISPIKFFYGQPGTVLEFQVINRDDEKFWAATPSDNYKVPESLDGAAMSFRSRVRFAVTRRFESSYYCDNYGYAATALARLQILKGSTVISEKTQILTNTSLASGLYFSMEAQTDSIRVYKNEVYKVYFAIEGYVVDYEVPKAYLYLYCGGELPTEKWTFENFVSPYFAENETVDFAKILPDITQGEFLANLTTALDLVYYFDFHRKRLIIENRATFENQWQYPLDAVDEKSINLKLFADTSLKKLIFSILKDDNDGFYNSQYKIETQEINPPYNNPAGNIQMFEIPFATTAKRPGTIIGIAGEVLAIAREQDTYTNGQRVLPQFSTVFALRLAKYVGIQSVNVRYHKNFISQIAKFEPMQLSEFVYLHRKRIYELFGKWVKLTAALPKNHANGILTADTLVSLRTPVSYKGNLFRVNSAKLSADSQFAELELVETFAPALELNIGGQTPAMAMAVSVGDEPLAANNVDSIIFTGETTYEEDDT